MKINATIEARMGSSRLPGKVMKKIVGKPMLELLIERVQRAKLIHNIIVATTINPKDDPIVELAERLGVKSFRGDEEDVLDRVLKAAKFYGTDIIVELTGDCPLIDPITVDKVIQEYLDGDYDYVSNTLKKTFPRGLDTKVFSTAVLEEVSRLTNDPVDREHVSLYIYEHPEKFKLHNVEAPPELNHPDLRLTVDTEEDLQLVKEIYGALYFRKPDFSMEDVIKLIDERPALKLINIHMKQKPVR